MSCWSEAPAEISALQWNLHEPHSSPAPRSRNLETIFTSSTAAAAAAGGGEGEAGDARGAIPRRRHDTLTSRGGGGAATGSSRVRTYNIQRDSRSGVKGQRFGSNALNIDYHHVLQLKHKQTNQRGVCVHQVKGQVRKVRKMEGEEGVKFHTLMEQTLVSLVND